MSTSKVRSLRATKTPRCVTRKQTDAPRAENKVEITPSGHVEIQITENAATRKKELLESLQCYICFNIHSSARYMCTNKHSICKCCLKKLPQSLCPWCRAPYERPPARNRDLEAKIDESSKNGAIVKCKSHRCRRNFVEEEEMLEHAALCKKSTPYRSLWAKLKPSEDLRSSLYVALVCVILLLGYYYLISLEYRAIVKEAKRKADLMTSSTRKPDVVSIDKLMYLLPDFKNIY